ncbi:unnamed protein product [Choristocarpus tenellus]|uniref:putative RuBisCO transcriptional regulator n=1 Tax=Choristocarpus tenellus TaxID=116065 RepID=UPI002E75DBD7|nr:putative RuBisCO transcriptional regulator [Choristocarpus tenellus]WAM62406.1 putative RuBisCO transcriptional regulator [Choristocarpus tenellus]
MKNFPFNLKQLKIIKTIANEGSFKKAAQILYISQPNITAQIQKLEKHIDLPLFERKKNKIYLTETGQLLLQYGIRILKLCEEVHKDILKLKHSPNGKLFIGASQTTGTYLLPRIIGLFRKRYPDISVQLELNSTRRIAWSVANGQIDIAIVGGEIPPNLKQILEITSYVEDELILILPKSHSLSYKKEIKKEDLYKLNFIALNKNSTIRTVIDQILNKNNIDSSRLKIEMELNSIEAIKNAVQSGLGVAFVSASSVYKELKLNVVQCVNIRKLKINRTLFILTNRNRYKSKILQNFQYNILNLFLDYKNKNE